MWVLPTHPRDDLLRYYIRNRPHSASIDFDELVNRTEGYSNADLEKVVHEAARLAVQQDAPEVTFEHLVSALASVPSSLATPIKRPSRRIGFSPTKKK